ncbi:MAG TPA: hypothetical protein DE117_05300 [Fervidobacterium sp.]|nr:hypothetical protein [Fervidobacterium sp.]
MKHIRDKYKLLHQTDKELDKYIQRYGCYFMSLYYHAGELYSADRLNEIWEKCIELGYISGDLNGDGDLDDYNEAVMVNPSGVAKELGLPYKYIGKHSEGTDKIPNGYIAVGCFYNERTKFTHFVAINKYKTVIYDPIPNSVTVREGKMVSMRLFSPV